MASPLTARMIDVPPDPLRLARALGGRAGAVLLWSGAGKRAVVPGVPPASFGSRARPGAGSGARSLRAVSSPSVPRWIGLLPYEARRVLERRGPRASIPTCVQRRTLSNRRGGATGPSPRSPITCSSPATNRDAVRELCALLRRVAAANRRSAFRRVSKRLGRGRGRAGPPQPRGARAGAYCTR